MNYISAENLTKSYGIKTLFQDISFNINEGDKIALVAKNGSGKTSLLKIILGKDIPDNGKIIINKEIQIVLFDQEINYDPQLSIQAFMMTLDSPPILALKKYHQSLIEQHPKEMETALAEMEIHKAWDLETEMKQILSQLKIVDLSLKMATLSGGQIKRVALAKLLTETRSVHKHTLLMMDEPTNHLDVEMVEWLENYLSKANITLLLVTHDRYFLDAVCDTIWEIEDQKLYIHQGSYATYLENKMIREENLNATIDKANNLYRKELEWMRRQPKARTTKSKSRIDDFYQTEKVAKTNTQKQKLEFDFEMQRLGKKILELTNINKSFGENVLLKDFSYQFQRGEKVGIVGKNGIGKSTLLNIIQGIETLDSGQIDTGETISFGYFSQKGFSEDFYKNNAIQQTRVIDLLKEISENFPLANGKIMTASQFLRLFLFDDQAQYTPIAKLSGGEKRRLQLLLILYKNPNFLIFDEPTNDLDLPTLTVLENFLQQFHGCVLIVSHDRYFLDKTVDHLIAFEGNGKIKNFVGSFSEYLEKNKQFDLPKNNSVEKAETPKNPSTIVSKKMGYKEKRELEELENRLPKLTEERASILQQLDGETDYEKIAKLSKSLEVVSQKIDQAEIRWLELQELLD